MDLAALTWTEVAERAPASVVAVPVGSTEQHGPHLPLSTDTDIAVELCRRLGRARPDVLVGPPVAYGSAGEHAAFPGTLSIGGPALQAVLVELGRSADAFAGVVFVSAHGGNALTVRRAAGLLAAESRRVRAWTVPPVEGGGDAHAGHTETSVQMALHPAAVRTEAATAGCVTPLPELMAVLAASGIGAVSPNGVLGDPTGASPSAGRRYLEAWAAALQADLDGWP